MQYQQHYTRDEARRLLPQIREWLKDLVRLRKELQQHDKRFIQSRAPGADLGGQQVNDWVRVIGNMKTILLEFESREIQVKDLDRGLIDFPAILEDKEVFLCWEKGEDDIEFWHDLEAGYAGRQRLEED